MPKRGRSRGNYHQDSERNGNQDYFGHDDRRDRGRTKHVSFKDRSNRGGKFKNDWEFRAKTTFEAEGDVEMAAGSSSEAKLKSRFNPYTSRMKSNNYGRRNKAPQSPRPRSPPRRLYKTFSSWYKVMVLYGAKYEQDYILKLLQGAIAPTRLVPRGYQLDGVHSYFYVDDFDVAEQLVSVDKKITTSKGFKLVLKIAVNFPRVIFTPEIKQSIRHALIKRYNRTTEAVDLSNFHNDQDIYNYHIVLFRHNIFNEVLNIMAQYVPDLVALNLSNNGFHQLDGLKHLSEKLPKLSVLHFGNNKVEEVAQLPVLQDLPLVEIVLEGNPLRNKFKDQVAYVSEIRKILPNIIKLDGCELPPPIKFDVDSGPTLPPSKKNFMVSGEGSKVIQQFLQQYYQIYDSEDRNLLMNAYHAISSFSLSCIYQPSSNSVSSEKLTPYFTESRNFLKTKDPARRQKLLKCGNTVIVSFLNELPKTKHDLESFSVDFSLCSPQHLMVVLSGFFQENFPKEQHLRTFSRTFLLSPSGEGYCIVNDQLCITNTNEKQAKSYSASTTPGSSQPSIEQLIEGVQDPLKEKLIAALCLQTGMNSTWSMKCLLESNWNFEIAIRAFLKAKAALPPEAFAK